MREKKILELRLSGNSFEQIAQEIGVSKVAVFKGYQRALAAIPAAEAAQERKASLARVDSHQLLINGKLDELRAQVPTPQVCSAIAHLELIFLKWEQRRAMLLGLDLPRRVEIEATARFTTSELASAREVLVSAIAQDRERAGQTGDTIVETTGETIAPESPGEPAQLGHKPDAEEARVHGTSEGAPYTRADLAAARVVQRAS
jgi:hypothetical protein